jgi:hypothetical protein
MEASGGRMLSGTYFKSVQARERKMTNELASRGRENNNDVTLTA